MKRADWIEYFELINDRKPTPEEYFSAKAAGEFVEDTGSGEEEIKSEVKEALQTDEISDEIAGEEENDQFCEEYDEPVVNANPIQTPFVVDQRGRDISFGKAIVDFFRGYWDFKGYTSRSGYWYMVLFNLLLLIISTFLPISIFNPRYLLNPFYLITGGFLYFLFWLSALIPWVAINVRRLRDVGFKGSGIFLLYVAECVPFLNILIALFLLFSVCQRADYFTKEYDSIFFRNLNQKEPLPDISLPERKSIGGWIGVLFIFLSFIGLMAPISNYGSSHHGNTRNWNNPGTTSQSSNFTEKDSSSTSSEIYQVDLSDYEIKIHLSGESGSGVARTEVLKIPQVSFNDQEVQNFLENPTIKLSKSSGLSNGDTIEVKLILDKDKAKRLGISIIGSYHKYYTVSKLELSNSANSRNSSTSNYWNEGKAKKLANYMVEFGKNMNQPNYRQIPLSTNLYWTDGDKVSSDYQIVDAYEYWFSSSTKVHRYFFAINSDGTPKVLYSQDTNGEHYNVSETNNTDLRTSFASIVNGD